MSKKAIWMIMILMSAALIGIVIIQFFWIKWQVELDEKAFDNKVIMALNQVRQKIHTDANNKDQTIDLLNDRAKKSIFTKDDEGLISNILSKKEDDWNLKRLKYEISSTAKLLDPNIKLESINIKKLDNYLKSELENRDIKLRCDYGIFSNDLQDFLIVNGNYMAPISGNMSTAPYGDSNDALSFSNYRVRLFDQDGKFPGELKIFFPNKTSYLWSSVWPSMLASFIFTGLILFCFAYTLSVIFKQKKISEMKTDFLNNMTHEFKTPIATISLAADSILSPSIISNENKITRFADIIKEENKRMLNQVEKVLQMAKVDRQDIKLKNVEINIHDLIQKAVRHMELKVKARNGLIETDLKAINPIFKADQNHISNILHNLLDNAEKYSDKSPKIMVSTVEQGKKLLVKIKDQGIGMNKETQRNVFDRFYRLHTGNRHDVKGFGLGLSYVKALTEAHKGTVKVESELEKGSTFTLTFHRDHTLLKK